MYNLLIIFSRIYFRIIITILILALNTFQSKSQQKSSTDVPVKSYERRDGTTVPSHFRTTPNYTNQDNFSTKGNTNPYNGKKGTINPDNNRLLQENREFIEYNRSDNNPNEKIKFFRYFPVSSLGIHTNTSGLGLEMTYRKRSNVFGLGYSIDMGSYSLDVSQSYPNYVDFLKIIYGRRIVKNYFVKIVTGIQTERNHFYQGYRFIKNVDYSVIKGLGVFGVFGEGNLSIIPEFCYDQYWGIGIGVGVAFNL